MSDKRVFLSILFICMIVSIIMTSSCARTSSVVEGNADSGNASGEGNIPETGTSHSSGIADLVEDHLKALAEVQKAENIKRSVLLLDIVKDCHVVVSFGNELPPALSATNPEASIVLTLNTYEMLPDIYLQSIVATVKNAVPNITDDNITITDSSLNHYPIVNKDNSIEKWIIDGVGFGAFDFETVEEANKYMSFTITVPSVLPENARLDSVWTRFDDGPPLAHAALLYFPLEVDEAWYQSSFRQARAHLQLYQLSLEAYASMGLEQRYSSYPALYLDPSLGYVYETVQIMVGGTEGSLSAYFMPVLRGLEAPSDESVVNASLGWIKGDIMYQLSVYAPCGMFDFDALVAIAESVG